MKTERGGFSYHCDLEKIKAYKKVPPKQKLQWLEEINALTNKVLTKSQKKFREKIRKGLL